jgi:hypothetical protein
LCRRDAAVAAQEKVDRLSLLVDRSIEVVLGLTMWCIKGKSVLHPRFWLSSIKQAPYPTVSSTTKNATDPVQLELSLADPMSQFKSSQSDRRRSIGFEA